MRVEGRGGQESREGRGPGNVPLSPVMHADCTITKQQRRVHRVAGLGFQTHQESLEVGRAQHHGGGRDPKLAGAGDHAATFVDRHDADRVCGKGK